MSRRFSPPAEPLVEKNPFRHRTAPQARIPDFEEIRPSLPAPVLPEDAGWEKLYWACWEGLWKRFRLPVSGSPLPSGFAQPGTDGLLNMGTTAFTTQISGYVPGPFKLIDFLDNFYAAQHDSGFICREIDPADGADFHQPYEPNSTGPNLLSWAEWRHFRLTGDMSRLADAFWPLLAHHRWCRANRTWRSGLYWTTGYASGLVNQPRVPNGRYDHQHWAWVDATAQAALDCALLERMAVLLGEQESAEEVSAERDLLVRKINEELWNDDLHFYQDIGPNDRFSPVKSIAAYWTLMDSQIVPKERLTPFIQHLRDTWSFRTEHVLPSMAADGDAYNARTGNGWRGAVWPSLTYMVLRGLAIADSHALAHRLAASHVDSVCAVFEQTGRFWQNYAPEDLGPGEPAVEDETGLTPAAVVPMILENILGFSIDWPLRQITWRRHLEREQAYGLRNFPLGDEGTLDLVGDGEMVRIRADAPFTLAVHSGQEVLQTAVPAGAFEISMK